MRHHELSVGEFVFDVGTMRAGTVTAIHEDCNGAFVHILADDVWNRKYMDLDTDEDEVEFIAEKLSVYQFAEGKVDHNGYPVCYEHLHTTQDYPFYSPVGDENMFNIEVWDEEDFNKQ